MFCTVQLQTTRLSTHANMKKAFVILLVLCPITVCMVLQDTRVESTEDQLSDEDIQMLERDICFVKIKYKLVCSSQIGCIWLPFREIVCPTRK